jgi:hypothetical protein
MSIVSKFTVDLEHMDENTGESTPEVIEVTMQETSPFLVTNLVNKNTLNGSLLVGNFVKDCIGDIILSPKNLVERIEQSDNGVAAIKKVFDEVNAFCYSPKRYFYLQKKREAESKNMGEDNQQPNPDGSQANE